MNRLSDLGDARGKERLAIKKVEDLLRLVNARATAKVETRGPEALMSKFTIRKNIGKIFKLKLRQEIGIKRDLESQMKGEAVKMVKTKIELTSTPGVILGLENYQGRQKRKLYFGYQLKGDTLKVAFLGEHASEQKTDKKTGETISKADLTGKIKSSLKLAANVNLFADIKLHNLNTPDQLGIKNLEGVLGVSLPKNQTVAVAFNPGKKSGSLTYIGRW